MTVCLGDEKAEARLLFTRCTLVQSAVLRLHDARLSVCDVGGSGPRT